jgi:hypothetical protein
MLRMSPQLRDKRLNILVTADEQRMLRELADRKGITPSDYVRLFIRSDHAATFSVQPVSKPRARKRK